MSDVVLSLKDKGPAGDKFVLRRIPLGKSTVAHYRGIEAPDEHEFSMRVRQHPSINPGCFRGHQA